MYNAPPVGQPQPRSGNKTLMIILLVIGVPCLLFIILGVVGAWSCFRLFQNTVMPMANCAIAYDEVRQAMRNYAKDHDGKLPNAATWEDDIRSYYAKVDSLDGARKDMPSGFKFEKMPLNGPWGCKVGENEVTGMAFNSALSGKKLSEIDTPYSTILLYEVKKSGKNLNGPYSPPPRSEAPKLFGEPREWMRIYVEGEVDFKAKGQNSFGPSPGSGAGTGTTSGAGAEGK
ncbi:MAG: hypothetical protein K1X67_04340 [Fimbriimonadaceae bacterium]|nr:hypothetical protein [Fimbriimonadaceae bacterium]